MDVIITETYRPLIIYGPQIDNLPFDFLTFKRKAFTLGKIAYVFIGAQNSAVVACPSVNDKDAGLNPATAKYEKMHIG